MKHLKKTLCLLLAVMMLLALGVPAMAAGEIPVDAEHFPDQALRTYVTDYCDTNKDNKLSAAECEAVQCIDLFEMKITKVADMTGIEHFTNLHELIACNNQIATLDLSGMKLAGCSALTQLDASSCALTTLDLTGCSALKTVACSYNALTALDVSAAEKLTTLECSANRLTALDLSGHKELKVLTCSLNALTKLDLTGCRATARPKIRSSARSICRRRPARSRTAASAPCTSTSSSARITSAASRACSTQTMTSRLARRSLPRRRTTSPTATTQGARVCPP